MQTGDVMPNLLGLLAGHTYYYTNEVAPRLELPRRPPSLREFFAAMSSPQPAGAAGAAESEGEGASAAAGGAAGGAAGEEAQTAAAGEEAEAAAPKADEA